MTPWLRLKVCTLRLLLVLTTALPVYGIAAAYATEPGPPRSSPAGHSGHDHSDHSDHDHSDHSGRDHSEENTPSTGPRPPTPAPRPSDSASASYTPAAAEPSRAGSRAGEGRLHPGRPDGPVAEVEGDDDAVRARTAVAEPEEPEVADTPDQSPTSSPPPAKTGLDPARPSPAGPNASDDADGPVLRILPLGSGLVLIGLGFGLAFVGLRLRKG